MPFRVLLAIAALVLAALAACGDAGGGPVASSDETARRDASQALDAVEELRAELEAQVTSLSDQLDAAEGDEAALLKKIARLSSRLDRAVSRVDRRFDATAGAATAAESALAEARSVARDLAVLDERLDYHLKSHPGG